MPETRRSVLLGLVATAGVLWGLPARLKAAQNPPPRPTPPSSPYPMGHSTNPRTTTTYLLTEKDQAKLKADIEEIVQLAAALKKMYGDSNLTQTLPIQFVKTAERLQKVAKQAKDLARG